MEEKNSNNNGGVGCVVAVIIFVLIFFALTRACSSGSDQLERDVKSGLDKMTTGEEMTPSEKNAVEGFLDWQAKQ